MALGVGTALELPSRSLTRTTIFVGVAFLYSTPTVGVIALFSGRREDMAVVSAGTRAARSLFLILVLGIFALWAGVRHGDGVDSATVGTLP